MIASIGKTVKKTKTHKKGGANPIWNEIVELDYKAIDDVISLEVQRNLS